MKRSTLVASAALLFACSGITEPVCACSPPGGGTAVITGTVIDPASMNVQGAAVLLRVMDNETCVEPATTLTTSSTSDAAGRFRQPTSWSGGRKCFRVWAEPPQGSPLAASESQLLRVDFGPTAVTPDSIDIVLQLR